MRYNQNIVNMNKILPKQLKVLAAECPFPLYVVGGACRDYLAGLSSAKRDWDICAPASAEAFEKIARAAGFETLAVYANTGTVKLCADGEEYEFTSFRSDSYVRGVHSPASIFFTDDITLDARRRDFKCNAVYYDVARCRFVDPLGGISDIRARILSTVASAEKVFGEDGLRLMRLARQAAQTGFKPDSQCLGGASSNSALICDISAERIWAELNLILHADEKYGVKGGQYMGLKLLKSTGVLARILPELTLGDGMEQRSDFHSHDVLEHSLRTVLYADKSVRLAALLHDVGKPRCRLDTGKYARHEEVGSQIAEQICRRLRVSGRLTEEVKRLTLLHMYDLNCAARSAKVRRFIVRNHGILEKLLLLKQADYSACKDDLSQAPGVAKWRGIYAEMLSEGVPFTLKELDIRGNELLAVGIRQAEVGKTLDYLLDECAVDAASNVKERLLRLALQFNRKNG